jgi:pilus assembly protein Flp/PilA
MSNILRRTQVAVWMLLKKQNGQDLVEYALIVALIGFGATAGTSTLAADLNTAFAGVGTTINSYVS